MNWKIILLIALFLGGACFGSTPQVFASNAVVHVLSGGSRPSIDHVFANERLLVIPALAKAYRCDTWIDNAVRSGVLPYVWESQYDNEVGWCAARGLTRSSQTAINYRFEIQQYLPSSMQLNIPGPTFTSGVKAHYFGLPGASRPDQLAIQGYLYYIVWDTKKAYMANDYTLYDAARGGAVPWVQDTDLYYDVDLTQSWNVLTQLFNAKGVTNVGAALSHWSEIKPYLSSNWKSLIGERASGVTIHGFGYRREENYWGTYLVVWNAKMAYSTDDWTKSLLEQNKVSYILQGLSGAETWAKVFLGLEIRGAASAYKNEIEPYLPGGIGIVVDLGINEQKLTKEAVIYVTNPIIIKASVRDGKEKVQKLSVLFIRMYPVDSTGSPVEQTFNFQKLDDSTYQVQFTLTDGTYDVKVILTDTGGAAIHLLSLTMNQMPPFTLSPTMLILIGLAVIGCIAVAIIWKRREG